MPPGKIALASLGLVLLVRPQGTGSEPVVPEDLAKLAWIAGAWELEEGETTTVEHWLPLAGSTMMGVSHTYDAETTRFFEFLRITTQHGKIAYVAQPGGGKPVPFLAVDVGDGSVVFENPQHDHPQRIRYERTEAGITATISMIDGTRAKAFAYRRREK